MKRRWDGGGEEVGEGEEAGGGGCSVRLHHPRRDEEGRYGEIWGDVGRYGEITSSTAGWNSAHHSDKKAAESRSDAEMASSLAYQ